MWHAHGQRKLPKHWERERERERDQTNCETTMPRERETSQLFSFILQ